MWTYSQADKDHLQFKRQEWNHSRNASVVGVKIYWIVWTESKHNSVTESLTWLKYLDQTFSSSRWTLEKTTCVESAERRASPENTYYSSAKKLLWDSKRVRVKGLQGSGVFSRRYQFRSCLSYGRKARQREGTEIGGCTLVVFENVRL